MKIIACIKTFNGEDYIQESVASIYNHVDEVIIADCCFGAMEKIVHPERITAGGLSGPVARAAMAAIPDPDDKITRWDVGLLGGDQTIMYNKFVQHADVGDAVWLVDDDEVYPVALAQQLEAWVREGIYHAVWLPSIIFWHDFYHIRPDHGNTAHQRIFVKLHDSAHYDIRNVTVKWFNDKGQPFGYGMPPKATFFEGKNYNVFVGQDKMDGYFHYAYVRTHQRMMEKQLSQYLQNHEPLRADEWRHCQRYKDPIDFKIQTTSWFTNHDFENIVHVDLVHPAIMDNHLWRDIRWDEQRIPISYEQACSLLNPNIIWPE